MEIVKFIKQKNGEYKLVLQNDEVISLHEDLILKKDLLLKRKVSPEEIKKLLEENKDYIAYSKALKYIGIKMRNESEVRNYLLKLGVSSKVIDDVVTRLYSNGYLNDREYAKAYINDRISLSNDGPYKIIKYLTTLNIKEEDIDDLIKVFDINIQKEKINKIINKYIKANNNNGSYLIKQKIHYNLINLGYDGNLITEELSKIDIDDSENFKKEYDKLYQKLSKKYSGSELEYKIKQKLFQKGFRV
ncbi:MAG: hypothetical protein ACI4OG_03740 [Bacilli bacterium]